ncbi:MAG: MFS transporter [Pseudomonadota bacterium]
MHITEKSGLGGIGRAFSDVNFRWYSVGAIATWIGYFAQLLAVSWYAWELTESTRWLAIVALLDILPNIVLMPLAGAVADRFDKYRMMGLVSLLALIQAIVLTVMAWQGVLTIVPFALLVLLHGVIISFMVPAMYGILPRFVHRSALTPAIAVSSAYAQLAVFIGPIVAGWVIAVYSVSVAFALNAIGYVIYLVSWALMKTPKEFVAPEKAPRSIMADVVDGIHYLINHKVISSLLVLMLFGDALGAAIFYMAPAFSEQILSMGISGVSVMLGAKGVGATLAAIWLAYGGEQLVTARRILNGYLLFVCSVFAVFVSGHLIVAIAFFVVMGWAAETYGTTVMSLVQLSVTEEQRGRVMGTLFMVAQLASGVGTYLIGYFAVSHGLIAPTLSVAVACLAVWALYFFRRNQLQDNLDSTPKQSPNSDQ